MNHLYGYTLTLHGIKFDTPSLNTIRQMIDDNIDEFADLYEGDSILVKSFIKNGFVNFVEEYYNDAYPYPTSPRIQIVCDILNANLHRNPLKESIASKLTDHERKLARHINFTCFTDERTNDNYIGFAAKEMFPWSGTSNTWLDVASLDAEEVQHILSVILEDQLDNIEYGTYYLDYVLND